LGLIAGGREGFSATLFYTTIYAITLVGAFAVCGAVREQTGGDDIKNFAGLSARSPFLAACITIFLLSLAGIPPLAGFFGKFYLFSVALHAGQDHGLLWLVAIALFGSFVSLYYYLMVLKAVLVDTPATQEPSLRLGIGERVTLVLSAVAVVLIGCMPMPLVQQILATVP
jgi:NADH-quinone oxidoreductase subunit N